MFAQKVKGIMVDLDVFNGFCTSWYTKYGNMKPYFFERLAASWIMKQGLVPAEHSLFENSLRKIYGRDFFDARDVMPVPYGYSCYGDLDGGVILHRMPANFLSKEWAKVGMYSNLATRIMKICPEMIDPGKDY